MLNLSYLKGVEFKQTKVMKKINEPKTTLREDLIFTTVAAIVIPTIFAIMVLIVEGVIWLNSL